MNGPEALIREFESQLEKIATAHRDQPADELRDLFTLGLAREAIVTVAYRRDAIEDRLQRMPLAADVRKLIARAIRWAWRDEEGHSLYVRGALLADASLQDRVTTLMAQLEGRIGGWASSRQQHHTWREAPATRLAAEALEVAGALSGRIPDVARADLHHVAFRDWCRFSHAAELTAGIGWRRMATLARAHPHLPESAHLPALEAMAGDEERHARLFATLAEALGPDDALAPGWSSDRLTDAIGSIGQRFLRVPRPGAVAHKNPLGKGGTVFVREGSNRAALQATLHEILTALDLPAKLAHRPRVAIKSTFMLTVDRADPSPSASPALLRALLDYIRSHGCEVDLIDARNIYDRFLQNRTVGQVAAYLDLHAIDAQTDQVEHTFLRGVGESKTCKTWRDADLRILVGKLRSHPTSTAFLSLEAAEGLGARHDDYIFVDRRADRETALLMELDALPPDVAILDAYEHVPDGLLGMMGHHDPIHPLRLYASTDAVALDAVAARHIGADPDDERMLLRAAFDWFGDPRPITRIDGPDAPIGNFRLPEHRLRTALLARLALPVFRLASLRGALFVPQPDESAFPPHPEHARSLHAARAAIRALTDDGLHADSDAPLPTHSIPIAGGSLRVADLGTGEPTILLHGYPDNLQIWARLARALMADRRVIAFDWPGLGYSSPWAGDHSPDTLAERLRAILDALHIERATFIAADMGVPPALVFAGQHPERVRGVVAMNSLLFHDAPTSLDIRLMRRANLARTAFWLAPSVVWNRCIHSFLPPGESLPEPIEADMRGAFQSDGVRERLGKMCNDYEAALPALPDAMFPIRAPILALWGSDEAHFPIEHAERLCRLVPSARLETLPGGHHWMAWSRADDVARRIRNWQSVT